MLHVFILHLQQNSSDNTGMITLGHCRTALARILSGDTFEEISEENWLILTLTVITFRLVK